MAGTSVMVRESNLLLCTYSVPEDMDADCRRSDSLTKTTAMQIALPTPRLTRVPIVKYF